jgi:hypothetical protein
MPALHPVHHALLIGLVFNVRRRIETVMLLVIKLGQFFVQCSNERLQLLLVSLLEVDYKLSSLFNIIFKFFNIIHRPIFISNYISETGLRLYPQIKAYLVGQHTVATDWVTIGEFHFIYVFLSLGIHVS